jgi:hypothetical protein
MFESIGGLLLIILTVRTGWWIVRSLINVASYKPVPKVQRRRANPMPDWWPRG